MPSLDARLSALETGDSHWTIVRPCPVCGALVPGPEASLMGEGPPCTRGEPHGDISPHGPRDIIISRSYAQPCQPQP